MNVEMLKQKASELFSEASVLNQINSEAEYQQALLLMDELVDDYDQYRSLIELLSVSIEHWENTSDELEEFNQRIVNMDSGVAVLRTLMDQYQLKADDLKKELGSKSLVSMILNGTRNLTREHIQMLSHRFGVSPSLFF